MKIDSISDEQELVLKEILSDIPTTSYHDFVVSTQFERRQSISQEDRLHSTITDHTVLPGWLEPAIPLGPYERQTLKRFLVAPSNLVLFRSGTGSGKSSLLNYLAYYCGLKSITANFYHEHKFLIRSFFSVIDLDGIDKIYSEELDRTKNKELCHGRKIGLFDVIADNVRSSLLASIAGTDTAKYDFLGGKFRELFHRKGPFITCVFNATETLKIKLGASWEKCTNIELCNSIIEIMDGEIGSRLRLFVWLSAWCQISYKSKNMTPSFPIVIAFDNVDQLAGYLQQDLSMVLQQFFTDQYCRESGITVVFMMRLSSARDSIASLPEPLLMTAHEPPSAIDLITLRLTLFLLGPEKIPTFRRLDDQSKIHLYARVFSFFGHLIDINGDMRKLLNGLAVTNLRIAFRQARKWISSPNNNKHTLKNARDIAQIQNRILVSIVPNAVLKVVHAIGRGIEAVAKSELDDIDDRVEIYPTTFVSELAFQLSSVLKHSRLLPMKTKMVKGPRCDIGEVIGSAILSFLQQGTNRKQPPKRAKLVMSLAMSFRKARIFGDPRHRMLARQTANCAVGTLLEKAKFHLTESEREANSLVDYFVELVCDGMKFANDPKSKFDKHRAYAAYPNRTYPIDYGLGGAHVKKSRFEAATLMLESVEIIESEDFQPVNLFYSSTNSAATLPLYILYRISEAKPNTVYQNCTTLEDLKRDVVNYGFNESDLYLCMVDMIRRDRRIIFSGVHDDARGVQAWREEPHRIIRLTWAGQRYLEDVAPSPPYLQWAFSRNAAFVARYQESGNGGDTIVERVRFALQCFGELIDVEIGRTENLLKKFVETEKDVEIARRLLTGEAFTCKGPMADIFFRSLPGFLESLTNAMKGSISRVRGDTQPPNEEAIFVLQLMRLAEEWGEAAEHTIDRFKSLFGEVPVDWETTCSWYFEDLRNFFNKYDKGLRKFEDVGGSDK
jgi:hypothetical protein